jgi:hypothetical protein
MIQELVFTTLPNQRTVIDGKEHLKVSVFVTSRIKSITEAKLSQVPDMLNWADKIKETTFSFRISGITGDVEAKLDRDQIDTALFHSIFHSNIIVEKYEMENLSLKQINSFPVKHVSDFLLKSYRKAAIESPRTLLPADFFIDPDKLGVVTELRIDPQAPAQAENTQLKKPLQAKSILLKKEDTRKEMLNILKTNRYIPFTKTPEPVKDFTQLKYFHKQDKLKIQPLIIKKPTFEFHNILSVVNSYPQIMRKLGFILDFSIPLPAGMPSSGTINLIIKSLTFTEPNTTVSVPLTAYNLTSGGFFAADKAGAIFRNGFVKINTDEFSVVQIDTDGVALKTANAVENKTNEVARFFEVKSRVTLIKLQRPAAVKMQAKTSFQATGIKPVMQLQKIRPLEKLKLTEPPANDGLPFMRTAGIALVRNGMSGHIVKRLERNVNFQNALIDAAPKDKLLPIKIPVETLYSEDLVMGYRMDIAYEDNPGKWHSLHQRKNIYNWFDDGGTQHPVDNDKPDEGYVELALTEKPAKPDDLYVSETLARWEGWSLSVRKPGYAINESDEQSEKKPENRRDFVYKQKALEMRKYAFDPTLDFKFHASAEIVPGTLPKLRFGKKYRLRIRTVDLCGNSTDVNSQSDSPAETTRGNIRYLRYEPLSSPIVLAGNALRDGEFLEQMVIRSNFDTPASSYEKSHPVRGQASDGISQRYLLPPKNSQLMAETHGMFDKAFGNNPETARKIYEIITSHEGLYQPGSNNTEKVYAPSEVEIIYLPDPMAAGVAIFADEEAENTHTQDFNPRMFGFFSKEEIAPSSTNTTTIPEEWYNAAVIRLKLEEGTFGSDWDKNNRILTVRLPKGQRLKLKISTFWRENDLKELSAIWNLIREGNPANMSDIESDALSGRHWMVSPARSMELVHAVQQPVEAPVLEKILPEREYGDTTAGINTRFSVHGESTDFVEIQAQWTEKADDCISVEIKDKNFRYTIPDIDIYYHDKTVTIGNIPELRPDLNFNKTRVVSPVWKDDPKRISTIEVQPGATRINQLYRNQAVKLAELKTQKDTTPKTVVNSLKFEIAESKLHLVKLLDMRNFPMEHSFGDTKHRWVDYCVVASSRYREYFGKILTADPRLSITRQSDWKKKINILSTARPAKPEIDYIVPIFEWQKSDKADAMYHRRKGGGLRIYLKRPWFSSGDDEMLAVILQNQNTSGGLKPITMIGSTGYTDYFTHWGSDPLFASAVPESYSPSPANFRLNPVVDDNLVYPGRDNTKATAVAYPVEFDKERQMWYCDIALNTDDMYFPFIKLALARYQAHSLRINDTDVCLSAVVMAGMIQLVPERKTTLKLAPDGNRQKLTISFEGPVYNERMSRYGVKSSLRISIIDTALSQPVQGVITDGVNKRKLENDSWEIDILQTNVTNNIISITRDFRLPEAFKTGAFQVIIEEIEHGPVKMQGLTDVYEKRLGNPEETDRLVFADVFRVNES